MTIGIVGAGGIGAYYAGLLSRAGQSVRLLARGDHLLAIQARGLEVRASTGDFIATLEATDDGERLVGCDYVFVAVKGYSLPEVAGPIARAARAGATIVPLLNGIDIPERLEKLGVPRQSIIGGFVRASLVRTAPGVVERKSPFDLIVVGELDRVPRERTTHLGKLLIESGITTQVSDDIPHDLWLKFAFITSMGVACGLSRRAMGPVLATEHGRALLNGAVHEIVLVSCGALSEQDEAAMTKDLAGLPGAMKPSFLLDLDRGGPTEVDLLAGTVSRMGKERGVATPIHDVAVAAFETATLPM